MIATLAIGLSLALLLGMLAQKLKLSPLIGYLAAGMAATNPWMPGIDSSMVEDFSHIGVVLLLFGVGLQFHIKDLLAVRKVAVPGSIACMAARTAIGALLCHAITRGAIGWEGSLMFGACLCVSSTVVLTRVLADNKALQTPVGHTAVGWLVVEDIFTIILLVLLPSLLGGAALAPALGWLAVKLAALVFLVAYVGRKLMGKIFTFLARNNSGELFTLAVLAFALGIAVLSAYVFNASMEFGAFLSGMVVGQSKFAGRAASEALPMRDAFAVLFFVSVGMNFHPSGFAEHWPLALSTLLLVLVVKPLTAHIAIRLLGKPRSLAVAVASSLAQIGEFSFILAAMAANTYHLLPAYVSNIITGIAIISITLNSILYRRIPNIIERLQQLGIAMDGKPDASAIPAIHSDRYRVIVVGYGPCGEILTRILLAHHLDAVVIEMNIDTVSKLAKEHIPALHGDARQRTILQLAGCEKAAAIFITAPGAPAKEIAAMARTINPDISVMANTAYSRHARRLREEGAQKVFSGEEEVALTMSTTLLRGLGASEEQISWQRAMARNIFSRS